MPDYTVDWSAYHDVFVKEPRSILRPPYAGTEGRHRAADTDFNDIRRDTRYPTMRCRAKMGSTEGGMSAFYTGSVQDGVSGK